jgi:hypothetical protein
MKGMNPHLTEEGSMFYPVVSRRNALHGKKFTTRSSIGGTSRHFLHNRGQRFKGKQMMLQRKMALKKREEKKFIVYKYIIETHEAGLLDM